MSPQNPSNRIPKEERRRQILDCATQLFSEKGFQDTTMDDVASAAKITKRTLYRYVENKEQLLFEIHDEFSGQSLLAEIPLADDPLEQFQYLITRHVEIVTGQSNKIAVFFDERKHLSPELQTAINTRRDSYEKLVTDAIAAAAQAGQLNVSTPRIISRLVLGALTEIYRWYEPDGRLSPAKISSVALDVFLHGITLPSKRPGILAPVAVAVSEGAAIRIPSTGSDDPEAKVRQAAIESFARIGYRASSIREMASLADVTKGTVMYHAQHKHKLLDQIITNTMKDGEAVLTMASDLGGEPVSKLARLLATHLAFMSDRHDEIAVANENLQYLDPARLKRISAHRREWAAIIERVVDEGIAAGDFTTPDTSVLKHVIIGMLNSTYRWFTPSGSLDTEDLAHIVAGIFLQGIAAPKR